MENGEAGRAEEGRRKRRRGLDGDTACRLKAVADLEAKFPTVGAEIDDSGGAVKSMRHERMTADGHDLEERGEVVDVHDAVLGSALVVNS